MILVICLVPGDLPFRYDAFIPEEELDDYNLDKIDNIILNQNEPDDFLYGGEIEDIFKRLGIEPEYNVQDFKKYMNISYPITISKILVIGWAV